MNAPLNKSAGELAAFRKLDTAAQLRQLRGQRLERVFAVERDAIDKEARTVWLSIASELEYERWWGREILEISRDAIRDARLKSGAPLLVGHDTADQVGVVEDYELSSDKKLRVLARFGRSARAEEIWQDVLDGIRRNASVGYMIHDLVLERQEEGVSTYKITDWEPLEGSLVPVPADYTVGVGRSANAVSPYKGKHMGHEDDARVPAARPSRRERQILTRSGDPAASSAEDQTSTIEVQRRADLLTCGAAYKDLGGLEVAERLMRQPGAGQEEFKRAMFQKVSSQNKPFHTAEPFQAPLAYGSGAREILPMPKHFTGEGAQERAYRAGMWFKGLVGKFIPRYRDERVEQYLRDQGLARAMSEGMGSEGGYLVPDELSPAIIDLADKYGAFRQNADVYPMKGDTLSVPKSAGDPTAAFVTENGTIAESSGSWAQVNLTAKKLGTIVRVSTELIEDSVIDVADRLALQLGRTFAKKEDECGFLGDGTSAYGGMTGVFVKFLESGCAGSKVAATTDHDLFSEIDAVDLSKLMAALPEYAHEGAKWYCSQVAWSMLFWRLMSQAGGNNASDMAGNVPKAYGGYPVVTSPTLPAGAATDYTGAMMIAFGNLRLSSKFGARRDIRIQVLNETYAAYDQIGVMATERFQIVNHDCGTTTVAGPIVGLVGG